MDEVKLKYGLEEAPPFVELFLIGLKWFVIAVPIVIIIGKIAAGLHFSDPAAEIVYIQKTFFITGIAFLVQLLWGHRLPLIVGPATILLVGIVAGQASGMGAVYTAIAAGGLLLFLLSIAGLFDYLKRLFTVPVVATILILVPFTLVPMILELITSPAGSEPVRFGFYFALVFLIVLFVVNRHATGFWKSTLIVWALIGGTTVYSLLFRQSYLLTGGNGGGFFAGFFKNMNFQFSFEPGVMISFLVCFLALSINDLGATYSVGGLLKPTQMSKRVTRGLALTGLLNFVSGLLG